MSVVERTDEVGLSLRLAPLAYEDLAGFDTDDLLAAFDVFRRSCDAIMDETPPLRRAIPPWAGLKNTAREALARPPRTLFEARRFFQTHFRPYRIHEPGGAEARAFLTGYYEPLVEGSLSRSPGFTAPILARPDNLDSLFPYPVRALIEAGAIDAHTRPLVWLKDAVEVFMVQVQGSARVRLADGQMLKLVYAGRNGAPYVSIGRLLIERGEMSAANMSLAALKAWVRAHGQNPGEAGLALLQHNPSYVFFVLQEEGDPALGPIGGQGLGLTALRSIAIDRALWPYGLPFWIDAALPFGQAVPAKFQRLMIAQDTGSAIVGATRADIFFGRGDDAGARAGDIRHEGRMAVLLPAGEPWPLMDVVEGE